MNTRFHTTVMVAFVLSVLASAVPEAHAKTIFYNNSPVAVKVAYQNPSEVVFDGMEIASVILGMDPEAISLQNTSNTLYIQPRTEGLSGDIFVVGKDGKARILTLVSTSASLRDRSIHIADPAQQIAERVSKVAKGAISPAGLIKAMVLGEDPDGVAISPTNQVIIEAPIRFVAETMYDAIFLKGYIVDMARNPDFDIKMISMKGLLAGAIYKGKGYFVLEEN